MTEQWVPQLGRLIAEGEVARRDCVHVAIAPAYACMPLSPGGRVCLGSGSTENALDAEHFTNLPAVGIVDPFLTQPVEIGQRFWIFLFPGTITGMRHLWSHPAFARKVPAGGGDDAP